MLFTTYICSCQDSILTVAQSDRFGKLYHTDTRCMEKTYNRFYELDVKTKKVLRQSISNNYTHYYISTVNLFPYISAFNKCEISLALPTIVNVFNLPSIVQCILGLPSQQRIPKTNFHYYDKPKVKPFSISLYNPLFVAHSPVNPRHTRQTTRTVRRIWVRVRAHSIGYLTLPVTSYTSHAQ